MVIDDEPLICQLLEYQLSGAGYHVSAFQHAYDALDELTHSQPDLILLDVMMPEISGWDLCRQIRASSNIPIVMLTAKDGDDDVVHGLTSGADDYLSKPFNQAQLIARIEAVLRRTANSLDPVAPDAPAQSAALAFSAAPLDEASLRMRLSAIPTPPARLPNGTRSLPPLGATFAAARQRRRLSLQEAGYRLGLPWEHLQAIEDEQFATVPREDLRRALSAYSRLLAIDLHPYATGKGAPPRRNYLIIVAMLIAVIALSLLLISLL